MSNLNFGRKTTFSVQKKENNLTRKKLSSSAILKKKKKISFVKLNIKSKTMGLIKKLYNAFGVEWSKVDIIKKLPFRLCLTTNNTFDFGKL